MKTDEQIASYLSQEKILITARGTSALWLILNALKPARQGVLVPANVCEVVIAAIHYAGLQPIYVDVDPIVGNFEVQHLELSPFQDAGIMIAVHNFGSPLLIREICDWAHSHDIFVIEDVCNALGAETQGYQIGSYGDAAIYSFGGSKVVDIGYGGALAVRDPYFFKACCQLETTLDIWGDSQRCRDIAFQECLRTLRKHSELKDPVIYSALYCQYKPALVARAADGTGTLIVERLKDLRENLDIRHKRAQYYRERLNHPAIVHRPRQEGEVCWRYVCHLPVNLRNSAVAYLRERDLPVSTWYPAVDKFFRERPHDCNFPGADSFERTVINLWVDPVVREDVIGRCSTTLLEYLAQANVEN